MQDVAAGRMVGPNSVLLLAVFFGKTRLIDNIRFE